MKENCKIVIIVVHSSRVMGWYKVRTSLDNFYVIEQNVAEHVKMSTIFFLHMH